MNPTQLSVALSKSSHLRSHSKKVSAGDLFYVMGSEFDAERYIPEVLARQPAGIVVPSDFKFAIKDLPVQRVSDVRQTFLEDCLTFYKDVFQGITLLGVTGTKGKTTVAYLLHWFLENLGVQSAYSGTLGIISKDFSMETVNTTPGLADFIEILQSLKSRKITHLVAEISSQGLAQCRVPVERFETRLFTGLSREHGTMHAYFEAKSRLFQEGGAPFTSILIDRCTHSARLRENLHGKVLDYGLKTNSLFSLSNPRYRLGTTEFDLMMGGRSRSMRIPWTGFYNLENYLGVLQALLVHGFDPESIFELSKQLPLIPGRMEEVAQFQGGAVFVDYAHTTEALEFLLKAVRPLTEGRLLVLFGCGGERDPAKRPGMANAAARYANQVFVTQDNPRGEDPKAILEEILPGFGSFKDYRVIPDRREAIVEGVKQLSTGDIFLVCGKGHEESQIIGQQQVRFSDREEVQKACGLYQREVGAA